MKKVLFLICLGVSGLIILEQFGVLNSLFIFLIAGVIPGTSYSLPSSLMLLIMITIMWLVIFRLAAVETFYSITTKRTLKRRIAQKKRMPRRRYNQI